MFLDRQHRVVSYHDTWISIDPVRGCPFQCAYCVLRHADATGTTPEVIVSPAECVEALLAYPLFTKGRTPLAIGNETDMFHPKNVECLIGLLRELLQLGNGNPIILITKAPLTDTVLNRIRSVGLGPIIFFLSYSGLGKRYEPNFCDEQLRANFMLVKAHDFPVVHFWRPLLPENTTPAAIERMLSFVSGIADATVFVGLKLHPELTRIISTNGNVGVPIHLKDKSGEWLESQTVQRIYEVARRISPEYRLYRHSSCALASILKRPNHTATVFRRDVCEPSQCPSAQRCLCEAARHVPSVALIGEALAKIKLAVNFERRADGVDIHGNVSQEEFSFLLHELNCPLRLRSVRIQNIYHGDILTGQEPC